MIDTKLKEFNKGQIVLAHDTCSTVCEIIKWIGAFLYLVKVGDLTWKTHVDQLKCFGNSLKSSQYTNKILSELAESESDTDWFNPILMLSN